MLLKTICKILYYVFLRSVLKLKLNISLILDANVSLLKHLKLTLIFYCWLHTFCEYLISTLYFMVCGMIWEIIFCTFILALNHSLPDQGFSTKLYQYLARQYSGAMEDVLNHSTTHERPKEENRKLPTNFKLVCGFKSVRKIMLQREFLKQRMLTSYSQKKTIWFQERKKHSQCNYWTPRNNGHGPRPVFLNRWAAALWWAPEIFNLVGRQNFLVNMQTVVTQTFIIKFMKSHFIFLYKHQEITKFVNFSNIKDITVTKKLQKAFGGPPICLY